MKRSGKNWAGLFGVVLLTACTVAPRDASRAPTMGECLWARGQSTASEMGGGIRIDGYAVQSCDAEIRAWERRHAKRQTNPNP